MYRFDQFLRGGAKYLTRPYEGKNSGNIDLIGLKKSNDLLFAYSKFWLCYTTYKFRITKEEKSRSNLLKLLDLTQP